MSNINFKKILLCVPHGGLNDLFCQIEKCRQYAQRFGRVLYIDTRVCGLLGEFSVFFKIPETESLTVIGCSNDFDYDMLNSLKAYPKVVTGRLNSYQASISKTHRSWCEKESDEPLKFDMDQDYAEDLIVHEQSGGGTVSHSLMQCLKMTDYLIEEVEKRLVVVPDRYLAIHVRNTDLKSDYISFFEEIKYKMTGQTLLVCSDDSKVAVDAKEFFSLSNVVTVTSTSILNQKPLLHLQR
jgi:hypothetical protein